MASLSWYINRLRRMSVPEILWRTEKMLSNRAWRISRAGEVDSNSAELVDNSAIGGIHPPSADRFGRDPAACLPAADRILNGEFEVFGTRVPLQNGMPAWNTDPRTGTEAVMDFGPTLDYRNPDLVGDIKFLWEPNRHLQFVTLAQACRLSDQARYADGLQRFWRSWLEQCPYLSGPNWTSSLELAIRLINWSFAWRILDSGRMAPLAAGDSNALRPAVLKSVVEHCYFIQRHYSRYSSANNHRIGEAAGVFVAACTWPELPGMKRWGEKALVILSDELDRQTGTDGMNVELTTAYHEFVMEFAIAGLHAAQAAKVDVPLRYRDAVDRMVECMRLLRDPAGNVPMFGDADDGHVFRFTSEAGFEAWPSLCRIGDALAGDIKPNSGNLDAQSLWLLDDAHVLASPAEETTTVFRADKSLPDSGYYLLTTNAGGPDEIRLWFDSGDLGYLEIAAHGHADALSVYLAASGEEILVDPGTYAYHTERVWRDYFKGTRAHNTVRVDGLDQSVNGGNFMWMRHAQARLEVARSDASSGQLIARHNGYQRLRDPVAHRRSVEFDKIDRSIVISDDLSCGGRHDVEINWHFAEHVSVEVGDSGTTWTAIGERVAVFFSLEEAPGEVAVTRARGQEDPPFGWVSRSFAQKVPSTSLCCAARIDGDSRFVTRLQVRGLGSQA